MHTEQGLYDMLRANLAEINKQIDEVKRSTLNSYQFPFNKEVDPDVVYKMTNASDGKPVLQDLLAAKANVLSSMANLKAASVANRTKPQKNRGNW